MTHAPKTFHWRYRQTNGQLQTGVIEAASKMDANLKLLRLGIHQAKIRSPRPTFFTFTKPIKPKDTAQFIRQLATLIASGVAIIQAFEIILQSSRHPGLKRIIPEIKKHIENGDSLATSLRQYPKHFDALCCNLVAVGEQSGTLDQMLNRLATYKEKMESIKKKIKKALLYPITVLVVALMVSIILLVVVIPQFADMFRNFGAELPAFTQAIITLSEHLQNQGWRYLGGLTLPILLFVMVKKRSQRCQHGISILVLKLPLLGSLLAKAATARFARTLATTFAAGVPLVSALDTIAGATGNHLFCEAVLQAKTGVIKGTTLHESLAATRRFHPMVVQMIAIGEQSGTLETMLTKVADIFEEDVDTTVDAISSLMEPFIMVFLGGIIGSLVLAMYLPVFQMGSVV